MFMKEKICKRRKIKKDNTTIQQDNVTLIVLRWINNAGIKFKKHGVKVNWLAQISTFCFLFAYFLQIIALVNAKDDPERLFQCFSDICFCGMGISKLFSLRYNKKWQCIIDKALELEIQPSKNTGQNLRSNDKRNKIIQVYNCKCVTISQILSRLYVTTAIIYILAPFVEYGILIVKKNECDGWPHILPLWTPLDRLNVLGYVVTLLIEFVAAIYCVFIHIAFDVASVGIMIFICGQFSLIRDSSEIIGDKDQLYEVSMDKDDRAHLQIIKCHKTHISIVNIIDDLGHVLQNILGVYFFVATLSLCSVAARVNSQMSTMQLISLIQYMGATLTQLFLFCFYGDKVFHETSVGQGEGPFGAAYWNLSGRARKELSLLAIGMAQPRYLKAGPFTTVNLPSFIQVIRTAYSYYAVVRQQ